MSKNFSSVNVTNRKSVPVGFSKSVFKKDDQSFSNLAQSLANGKSVIGRNLSPKQNEKLSSLADLLANADAFDIVMTENIEK